MAALNSKGLVLGDYHEVLGNLSWWLAGLVKRDQIEWMGFNILIVSLHVPEHIKCRCSCKTTLLRWDVSTYIARSDGRIGAMWAKAAYSSQLKR